MGIIILKLLSKKQFDSFHFKSYQQQSANESTVTLLKANSEKWKAKRWNKVKWKLQICQKAKLPSESSRRWSFF